MIHRHRSWKIKARSWRNNAQHLLIEAHSVVLQLPCGRVFEANLAGHGKTMQNLPGPECLPGSAHRSPAERKKDARRPD
ncbi:hypothetical protein NDU88_003828 [Pleurodeles waltl]|uniref:Uncharacterized protein n=1 Tax=Pleurodeles waltl TaxID=8319 RepID=A0AAV7W7A8_PLEWA|nr:hypothetical protein NDU88_003828 [Pleurodeles waltl]